MNRMSCCLLRMHRRSSSLEYGKLPAQSYFHWSIDTQLEGTSICPFHWWGVFIFIFGVWEAASARLLHGITQLEGTSICPFHRFGLPCFLVPWRHFCNDVIPKIEVCAHAQTNLRMRFLVRPFPLLIEYFYSKKKRQRPDSNPRPLSVIEL